MINVGIVCERYSSREGIKKFISDSDIKVLWEAGTGKVATQLIQEKKPDVIILDAGLSDIIGLQLCELIHSKFPAISVIFLLSDRHFPTLTFLMNSPAKGFITLNYASGVEAIKTVYSGETYLQPNIACDLFHFMQNDKLNDLSVLSKREYKVLLLAAKNKTSGEIAEHCHISLKTVFNLKSSGMKKLKIHTGDREKLRHRMLGSHY